MKFLMVGERLKQIREKKGLNQVQLAELSGLAQSTISTIEHGATPNIQIANKLAKALNVEIEDFLKDEEAAI